MGEELRFQYLISLLVILCLSKLVTRWIFLSFFFVSNLLDVCYIIQLDVLIFLMFAFFGIHASKFLQVAADGILVSGHSLALDESSMTGESKIVSIIVAIYSRIHLKCKCYSCS